MDEPTIGEVMRRLEDVRQDIKEDVQALAQRLDTKVSSDVFKLEQAAQDRAHFDLIERVKAIETAKQRADDQRAADRRLLLTALVVPVVLLVLQVYLAAKGVGA